MQRVDQLFENLGHDHAKTILKEMDLLESHHNDPQKATEPGMVKFILMSLHSMPLSLQNALI